MLDSQTQLLIASGSSNGNTSPLTFITGLKYSANVVKALNNLTFIYDPNWEYESQNATYPLAFFHVKRMTESMETETSQKPLLFYNSEAVLSTNSVKGSLLNIISDNIIIKPKAYKLDILIPMNITNFFDRGYFSPYQHLQIASFVTTGGAERTPSWTASLANTASKTLSLLKTVITALYGTELSASSLVTMLSGQQDYNKNSIEYMWKNRRILKLKMWTGWNFKYVVITHFEVTKTGENGDYYEGTLTCQEIPILTLKPSIQLSTTYLSSISSVLGKGIKVATDAFIGAMESVTGVKQ